MSRLSRHERFWSEEDKEYLWTHVDKQPLSEIAAKLGRSKKAVSHACYKEGLGHHPQKFFRVPPPVWEGDTVSVFLTGKYAQGRSTLIDASDYDLVKDNMWLCSNMGYAYRTDHDGPHRSLFLHRFLMQAEDGVEIDHINRNPLDNRRRNLRFCTRSQNNMNKDSARGRSRFRGVYWAAGVWRAYLVVDRKKIWLGSYPTEEEAAAAYNEGAAKHFGEFANPNVI